RTPPANRRRRSKRRTREMRTADRFERRCRPAGGLRDLGIVIVHTALDLARPPTRSSTASRNRARPVAIGGASVDWTRAQRFAAAHIRGELPCGTHPRDQAIKSARSVARLDLVKASTVI